MKLTTVVMLGIAVLSTPPYAARADCAGKLTSSDIGPNLPLPPNCRSLGPIQLGMSLSAIVAVMGQPDRKITEPASIGYLYWFPRHADHKTHSHGDASSVEHHSPRGVIQIVFVDDKVVNIKASAISSGIIPYSVGGISVGQSIEIVLRKIKMLPQWNNTKDYIQFRPYPVEIEIAPGSKDRIGSITISTWSAIYDSYLPQS